MRIIFAGRDNAFNRRYIKEISRDHDLVCCLFLEPDRFTLKGRMNRIKKRIQRYGLIQVLDELLFQIYSRYILRCRKEKELKRNRPEFFEEITHLNCPTFQVKNIHGEKWLSTIKEQEPDVILSICCNVIFKPELYNIPKFGIHVLHEGITPEYKGLHTPVWAWVRNEPNYLGYTLLKVNDEIDGGDVICQGQYQPSPEEGVHTWSWTGHNALIQAIPDIQKMYLLLEEDSPPDPLKIKNRKSRYFTWMRFSVYLRARMSRSLMYS